MVEQTITIKEYLDRKGIQYKEHKTELQTLCLFSNCDKKNTKPSAGHLSFNIETSVYNCLKCGNRGNIFELAKFLGDDLKTIYTNQGPQILKVPQNPELIMKAEEYYTELMNNPKALKWLTDRGITQETIEKFQLGYNKESISIPHKQNNKTVGIKYRKTTEKMFWREKDTPSILFNTDNLDYKQPSCVVVEGEFDCIIGQQEGIKNIIAITIGAQSFKEEWLLYLNKFKKVYICLDNDKTGQEGAIKLAESIGIDKCLNILLPEKDLNDFFLTNHKKDELKELFKQARPFEGGKRILSLKEIYNMEAKAVPFILQDMIVENAINTITSTSGQGKSLIVLKMAEAIAKGEDFLDKYRTKQMNVLIMDMEMSSDEVIRRCQSVTEAPIEGLDVYMCQTFNIDDKGDFEWLVAKIKENNYGLIIFDTLSAIHSRDENSNTEMNKINAKLLRLIHEQGITILFLHHNRKPFKGEISNQASTRGASCIIDKASSQLIVESRDITIVSPDKKPIKGLKLIIEQFKRRSSGLLERFGIEIYEDKEKGKTNFKWAGIEEKTETAVEKASILILNAMMENLEYSKKELVEELKDDVGERNITTALRALVDKGTLHSRNNSDGRNEHTSKRSNLYSLTSGDINGNNATMQTRFA